MADALILLIGQGDFNRGFPVTLTVGNQETIIATGYIPPLPSLAKTYSMWEKWFIDQHETRRIKSEFVEVSENDQAGNQTVNLLLQQFEDWLSVDELADVRHHLREILAQEPKLLLYLTTDYPLLWKLPWQSWSLLAAYSQVEVVINFPGNYTSYYPVLARSRQKIHILVILGDQSKIDLRADLQILQQLPAEYVEIRFLGLTTDDSQQIVGVTRRQVYDALWDERGWDILFFAGHSATLWEQNQEGQLMINSEESLTLTEIQKALRSAVALGLKLAIFNSCDGLGLARGLAKLRIPQVIVMRQPVPDFIAQEFLREFLSAFVQDASVEFALQQARFILRQKEERPEYQYLKGISGLPILCGQVREKPITWSSLLNYDSESATWESYGRTLLMLGALQRLKANLFSDKRGLELEDIYIPVGLEYWDLRRSQNNSPETDETENLNNEPIRTYELIRTYEQAEFFEQVIGLQEGSPRHPRKRLAIVGEPGSGKSLFLQRLGEYLVWESDRRNTLVISIALADLKSGQSLDQYLQTTWLETAQARLYLTSLNPIALKERFQQGKVWLLLDAADEMPVRSGNPLPYLVNQLERYPWLSSAHIVLTCREYLWEVDRRALQNFDVYRKRPFTYASRKENTPDQVEAFILRWFIDDLDHGKQLRQALDNPGRQVIRELVRNPLCLSLLCLVWQQTGNFPETRTQLYKQYVEALYLWKKQRFTKESGIVHWNRPQFKLEDKTIRVLNEGLSKLARRCLFPNPYFQLFRQWLSMLQQKKPQSSSLVKFFETLATFSEDVDDHANRITALSASACLGSYLPLAVEVGVLTQVGDSHQKTTYAFFHPTFQTYFASLSFKVTETEQFLLHKNMFWHPAYGRYRIFDSEWREVILCWIGQSGDEVDNSLKEQFLEQLWNFKDQCQGFYSFQAQFLATAALAEFQDCPNELADSILKEITNLGISYFNNEDVFNLPYRAIQDRAEIALQQTDRRRAIQSVQAMLKDMHSDCHFGFRLNAALFLNQLDPGNPDAVDIFIVWLKTSEDSLDRIQANEWIMDSAYGNESAIDVAISRLESSSSIVEEAEAATLLVTLTWGISNKQGLANKALKKLLEKLSLEQDLKLSSYLPESFEIIARHHPSIIPEILPKLATMLRSTIQKSELDDYWEERLITIATSILKLDPTHQDAIKVLAELSLSSTSSFHEYGRTAVYILERFAEGNLNLTYQAPLKTNRLGATSQALAKALTLILREVEFDALENHKFSLWKLLEILSDVALDYPDTIEMLEAHLSKATDPWDQLALGKCLGKISPQHLAASRTLQQLSEQGNLDILHQKEYIEIDQQLHLRKYAISTLIEIHPEEVTGVHALIQYLRELCQCWQQGIDLLDCSPSEADQILRERRKNTYDYDLDLYNHETQILKRADSAKFKIPLLVETLGKVGGGYPEAIATCRWMLKLPLEPDTLAKTAKALGLLKPGDSDAIETLLSLCPTSRSAVDALINLARQTTTHRDPVGRQRIIAALSQLVQSASTEPERFLRAATLGQLDPGNLLALHTLLDLLKLRERHPSQITEALKKNLQGDQATLACQEFIFLTKSDLLDSQKQDQEKFNALFDLYWHFAEQLSYVDFFRAWHHQSILIHLHPKWLIPRLFYACLDIVFELRYHISHPAYLLAGGFNVLFTGISWLFKGTIVGILLLFYPLFLLTKPISYLSRKWWGFDLVKTSINVVLAIIGGLIGVSLIVIILGLPILLIMTLIKWALGTLMPG